MAEPATNIDDRRSGRIEVHINAGMRGPKGRRQPVTIRNISCHGFMAQGGDALAPGTRVTLDLSEDLAAHAQVIWRRDGHFGGSFLAPLTEDALDTLV